MIRSAFGSKGTETSFPVLDVFVKVVDAYTMTESVKDEITVRIVYEGRAAKIELQI